MRGTLPCVVKRMRERLRAIAPYAIVLLIAGGLYWMTRRFDYTPRPGRPGPDVWPRAILALIALVCVVRIALGLRSPRAGEPGANLLQDVLAPAAPEAPEPAASARTYPWLLLLGIVLTAAYVLALGTLGFALATAVYIAAMIRTGRYARWRVIVPTAVLGSVAFMFVFQKVVYLSLPIGEPPFAAVSLLLMRLMGIR